MHIPPAKTHKRASVLIASIAICLCIGTAYTFSIFAQPLAELFGWSLSQVMLAFSICAGISPLPMIIGGKLLDAGWGKGAIIGGGMLFATCLFLTGFINRLWLLYLLYGIGGGMGLSISYSGLVNNSIKLYADKRGIAGGLITAAYGASAVLMAPVANLLIQNCGVMAAFRILGLFYLLVTGIAAIFITDASKFQPPQMPKPQTPNLPLATNLHWRQMLKTTRFYLLILIFISGTMAGLMLVSNTAVMGQTMFGLTATTAALFVSIYALCNCGGRFIFGMLSDRLGHYQTIILICLLISIVLLQAAIIHNLFSFLLTLIGVGLGFGGIMGIFPSLTSALFGLKYCGVNYGVVFIGYSLGALIGPKIAAAVATATGGDFTPAFLIAMGFSLAGMVFTMLLKKSTT